MRHRKRIIVMAAAVLALTSCKDYAIRTFGTQMEQFAGDSSKVYLGHAEEWLFWDDADEIALFVGNQAGTKCTINQGQGTLNAIFASLDEVAGGDPCYGFYPHSIAPASSADGGTWTVNLPATQPYRLAADRTHPDSSFGKGVIPMVSFFDGSIDEVQFYFHPVCGILRLQFFSSQTAAKYKITSIDIEDRTQRLSGAFTITNAAIRDPEPFITPTDSPTDAERKISITGISTESDKWIGKDNTDKLYTFYVPLPSTKDMTNPSQSPFFDEYHLKVTVNVEDEGGNAKQCVKTLTANIHRCNITMMRALDLTSFADAPGTGAASVSLVGSGTHDRPFQIYTIDDLQKVRSVMDTSGEKPWGTINGQTIKGVGETGGPTYIKVVRSDIVLNDDWEPIKHFKGYLYFSSSSAHNGGITNNSHRPLFDTICSGGKVEDVHMRSETGHTVAVLRDIYAPMCYHNFGEMKDCQNECDVVVTNGKGLAGLCAINDGTIDGGANDGDLQTSGNVAGVCYLNRGTLRGSFTMSRAVPKGVNIGGICYVNNGMVRECIVSSNINPVRSTGNWGVIVYNNLSGGTIFNCRATGTLVYTTDGSIGGICNTNSGTVKDCSSTVTLEGATGSVGGIVAVMNGGTLYNCDSEGQHYINGQVASRTADNAGGIVGLLTGGKVMNSYNHCMVTGATNSGGIVGRVVMTQSDIDNGNYYIENCWSGYGHRFKGYIYDTVRMVGSYCFSAATSDNNALVGCNLIENTYYRVTGLLPELQASGVGPTGTTERDTLVYWLNHWVDSANGGPTTDFRSWSTSPKVSYLPRLVDLTPTNKALRRPRSPRLGRH